MTATQNILEATVLLNDAIAMSEAATPSQVEVRAKMRSVRAILAELAEREGAVRDLMDAAKELSPWRVGFGNSLDHEALARAQKNLEAKIAAVGEV